MTLTRAAAGLALTVLLGAGTTACGSGPSSSASDASPSPTSTASKGGGGGKPAKAGDTTTCVAGAKPWKGTEPADFARDFPLPTGAVMFGVQDRGTDGVVATSVVKAGLRTVLAHLNGPAQKQGFRVTKGETEAHDAEANWTGNGYRGRWAIRDSATCPGEVVLQVLSKKK